MKKTSVKIHYLLAVCGYVISYGVIGWSVNILAKTIDGANGAVQKADCTNYQI